LCPKNSHFTGISKKYKEIFFHAGTANPDLSKVRDSVKQLTDVANFVSETPMFVALKRIWLKRLPMNRLRVTELRAKETKRIAFGNDFIDFESGGYRK
jgi:hypothetical protein